MSRGRQLANYTQDMIDPATATAAGAIAGQAAKNASESSAKKSELTHAAYLDAMRGTEGFSRAVELRAERLEAKEGALNLLSRPLFWLSAIQEKYFAETFPTELAEKMLRVEVDNVVPPDLNVGVQAVDGLSYSLDSPELKDMYLSLLATASDQTRQTDAHPGFASIIRQLSAREAVHLPDFLNLEAHGSIANVTLTNADGASRYLARHVPSLTDNDTGEMIVEPNMSSMIDNWIRLGLVVTSYQSWSPDGGAYDFMKERPEYLHWADHYAEDEAVRVGAQPGIIYPTDFGRQFGRAVLQ